MSESILALAAELQRRGAPFALATVVRCERPTSAKPGAKALVREDGAITGWVGGACAEPVVVREALEALRDGQPRLVALVGQGRREPGRTEGLLEYAMTCHSGGTLEIYVEPWLPEPLLVLVGQGPVVETLATLGWAAHYAVVEIREDIVAGLGQLRLTGRASVVVATHGGGDEEALEHALRTEAGYVSLVASRRRAAVILDGLERRGLPAQRLARLKAPAGFDIGAVTPAEIAVSILAEVIHHRRSAKIGPAEPETAAAPALTQATDPICGMRVDVASAKYRSTVGGRLVYFCCRHCQETFERDPERHRGDLDA